MSHPKVQVPVVWGYNYDTIIGHAKVSDDGLVHIHLIDPNVISVVEHNLLRGISITPTPAVPEEQKASTFIQWKGTDVCMDLRCSCGHTTHFDESFLYYATCESCGQCYKLGTEVSATKCEDPNTN